MSDQTSSRKRFLKILIFALITLIGIAIIVLNVNSNPLRKSPETIEANLLKNIPIGTPLKEVRLYFVKDESVLGTEQDGIVDLGEGKYWQSFHVTNYKLVPEISLHLEEGGSGYRVGLGNYKGFPWVVRVDATLVFDPDQKLKHVTVKKWQDAL